MNTDHTEYENLNELLKTFFSFFKKNLVLSRCTYQRLLRILARVKWVITFSPIYLLSFFSCSSYSLRFPWWPEINTLCKVGSVFGQFQLFLASVFFGSQFLSSWNPVLPVPTPTHKASRILRFTFLCNEHWGHIAKGPHYVTAHPVQTLGMLCALVCAMLYLKYLCAFVP